MVVLDRAWVVRVALQEFSQDGDRPMSHHTVGRVRDAFADIIMEHNRADTGRFAQRARHGFILVRHLHDEATMRMRSLLTASSLAGRPCGSHIIYHCFAFCF